MGGRGICVFCGGSVLSEKRKARKPKLFQRQNVEDKIPESVDAELDAFFVVRRLLRLGDEVCGELLREWGRPALWEVDLCSSCGPLVEEARHVLKQMGVLERQLVRLKAQMETKIVISVAGGGGGSNESKSKRSNARRQKSAVEFIRETVVERCKVPVVGSGGGSIVKIQPEDEFSDDSSFCCFAVSGDENMWEESRSESETERTPKRKRYEVKVERLTRSTSGLRKESLKKVVDKKKEMATKDSAKRQHTQESPSVAAIRMANFLKTSLILKRNSTPKSASTQPKNCGDKKELEVTSTPARPTTTTTDSKSKQVNESQAESILGQQVDKLCEELQKEIESLNVEVLEHSMDSTAMLSTVNPENNMMGVEILPDAQQNLKIDKDESDDVDNDTGALDDNDYIPDNEDGDGDTSDNSLPSDAIKDVKDSGTETNVRPISISMALSKKKTTKKLPFACSECEEHVINQFFLELHLRHKHSKFYCPECKICLETWDDLDGHTKVEHPNIPARFLCHLCPKRFVRHDSLVAHLRGFHEMNIPKGRHIPHSVHPRVDITAKCTECDRTFTNASCLASHVRLMHPTEEQKICKYCKEKFETMAKLMIHLRMNHVLDKSHMCDQCPKTFAYERQLVSHQNREHGVPFPENFVDPKRQCEDCGKIFCRGKALVRHRLTVHGNPDKNFVCPREGCQYRSFSDYEMKKHVLYVHDKAQRPKRIKKGCPECGNYFAGNYSRDLHLKNVHGRTDINVKQYELPCSHCPKKFKHKRYLFSHLNRAHGENNDLSIFPPRKPDKRQRNKRKVQEPQSDSEDSEEVEEEYIVPNRGKVQYRS